MSPCSRAFVGEDLGEIHEGVLGLPWLPSLGSNGRGHENLLKEEGTSFVREVTDDIGLGEEGRTDGKVQRLGPAG